MPLPLRTSNKRAGALAVAEAVNRMSEKKKSFFIAIISEELVEALPRAIDAESERPATTARAGRVNKRVSLRAV